MTLAIVMQFVVVLAAIWMGSRYSGVGLGLWGAVGLLILVVAFGVSPTSPPIDVMLIILAVIMAASVMDAAGGIDFLVRIAERIIRANPKYVTIVAPLTTWSFTFVAGTGHIVYPLLPVIYETAHRSGIRPERPMAVATIASQQAITARPVARLGVADIVPARCRLVVVAPHPDDDHRVVRDRAERSHLSELLLRHNGDIKAVCAALADQGVARFERDAPGKAGLRLAIGADKNLFG